MSMTLLPTASFVWQIPWQLKTNINLNSMTMQRDDDIYLHDFPFMKKSNDLLEILRFCNSFLQKYQSVLRIIWSLIFIDHWWSGNILAVDGYLLAEHWLLVTIGCGQSLGIDNRGRFMLPLDDGYRMMITVMMMSNWDNFAFWLLELFYLEMCV